MFFQQMWSLEFVEVADEDSRQQRKVAADKIVQSAQQTVSNVGDTTATSTTTTTTTTSTATSSSVHKSAIGIPRSTAVDRVRLDEFKDPTTCFKSRLTECSSSVDSDTGHMMYAVQNWLHEESVSNPIATTTTTTSYGYNEERDDVDEIFVMDDNNSSCSLPQAADLNVDVGIDAASLLLNSYAPVPSAATPVISSNNPFNTSVARQTSSNEATCSQTASNDNSPISGDYCFVTDSDVKDAVTGLVHQGPSRRKLRDGFRWQKQLVFRSKLTMHTAFERKDNKDPAAVTALALSR
jgi:hypothetical protein